jgi:hypothetical protein
MTTNRDVPNMRPTNAHTAPRYALIPLTRDELARLISQLQEIIAQ